MDLSDEEDNIHMDEDSDENDEKTKSTPKSSKKEEEAIDPSREDLYGGFFDLREMDNFADEEEEMLPDEAFGETEVDNETLMEERKKLLPHLRAT